MRLNTKLIKLLAVAGTLAIAVLFIPKTSSIFAHPQDELDVILKGVKSAAGSISSGSGKVIVRNSVFVEPQLQTESTYTLTFNKEKYRYNKVTDYIVNGDKKAGQFSAGNTVKRECAFDGIKATQYDPDSGTAKILDKQTIEQQVTYNKICHNPCSLTMDFDTANIEQYLECGLKIARKEKLDGVECIVLQVSKKVPAVGKYSGYTKTYEYWVSPSEGYCIRRSSLSLVDDKAWHGEVKSDNTLSVSKRDDGQWVPVKYTETHYTIDPVTSKHYTTYTKSVEYQPDFKFNIPLGNDAFDVKFASGLIP